MFGREVDAKFRCASLESVAVRVSDQTFAFAFDDFAVTDLLEKLLVAIDQLFLKIDNIATRDVWRNIGKCAVLRHCVELRFFSDVKEGALQE
jgi:hypothetical protein